MRDAFPILWWLAAAVVIALLLISMGYAASQAILLAVFFLPGMLCARYFYPQLSFEERRKGVLDTLYLTLAILCTEYLALILGHRTALPDDEIPDLLFNPLFILLVLSACILPEILIERRLEARRPYDRMLRFVSDRRPVTLDPAELLYVESNDSEVWLHTRSGEAYRTKTRISQWEALLDRRFLRIHRSYIINTECIEEYHPTRIRIGGSDIEISRKYKEAVRRRLGPEYHTPPASPAPPVPPLRPDRYAVVTGASPRPRTGSSGRPRAHDRQPPPPCTTQPVRSPPRAGVSAAPRPRCGVHTSSCA